MDPFKALIPFLHFRAVCGVQTAGEDELSRLIRTPTPMMHHSQVKMDSPDSARAISIKQEPEEQPQLGTFHVLSLSFMLFSVQS